MRREASFWVLVGLVATAGSLAAWGLTGAAWFTKYREVATERVALDPGDPLAGTGFYDDDIEERAVMREVVRVGLLPSGGGGHLVSVLTVSAAGWAVSVAGLAWGRRGGRNL